MQRCMGCMEMIEDEAVACPLCGYVKGTPPKEAYHMPPESILAARYIVGRVLGFGGFGVTYIGWDAQLERKVAIKEFLPSSFATRMPGYTEITVYGGEATLQFEAGLSRFTEEAKRLAGFNSVPGIVDIYDTFVENNTAYIAMQFLQGQDVKQILAQKGNFSFEEALPVIVSICDTLQPVHSAGIIHRDIAPDNIYITKEGEVKLLDFGASRFATGLNSKSLSVILKSGYAPEEQYRSKGDQGSWSDVYALAATFYKMLTGVTPEDSMERSIRDELKTPSQLGAELPKDAENAIMNALNIRRENRTQTVEEFKKALTGDRVARVKEKAVRSDTGSLPLWGKMVIAGSLVAVLLLGLLTVTGVIDFGQGNLLADTFGSGVPEGQVNAPGVVNQMEAKAQKVVKKAGLEYLIVGTEYSDDIEKGRILSQEPLPGRLIEIGSELQVSISGGSREEAAASGEIKLPDLTYMNMQQAYYALNQAGYQAYVRYEYSDTVAEGLIISYEEGYTTQLTVSAGKNDANPETGALRAPSMYVNETGTLVLEIAVASARETTGGDQKRFRHQFYYSIDEGANWFPVQDTNVSSGDTYDNYYVDEWSKVPKFTLNLESYILNKHTNLSGKNVRFKVERWWDEDFAQRNGQDGGSYIDAAEFTQVLSPVIEGESLTVNALELLTWEEIGQIIAKDKDMENTPIGYSYRSIVKEGQEAYTVPVRVTGDFVTGNQYQIAPEKYVIYDVYQNTVWCNEDGAVYIECYMQDGEWETQELTVTVWPSGETVAAETGDLAITLTPSGITQWKAGQKQESATGKSMAQFLSENKFENTYVETSYAFSETVKEGKIIQFSGDEWNKEVTVSAGSETEEANRRMRGLFVSMSDYGTLRISYTLWPKWETAEGLRTILSVSADGGNSWEIIDEMYYYPQDGMLTPTELSLDGEDLHNLNKYDGKALQLKVELENEANELQESSILEQTVTIKAGEPAPSVTTVQEIEIKDLDGYINEGRITDKNRDAYYLYDAYNRDPSYAENNQIYLLTGDFNQGTSYFAFSKSKSMFGEPIAICETDGELIVAVGRYEQEELTDALIRTRDFACDQEGNIAVHMSENADILPFIQ